MDKQQPNSDKATEHQQKDKLHASPKPVDEKFVEEVREYYFTLNNKNDTLKKVREMVDIKGHQALMSAKRREFGLKPSATMLEIEDAEQKQYWTQKKHALRLPDRATDMQVAEAINRQERNEKAKLLVLSPDTDSDLINSRMLKFDQAKDLKATQAKLQEAQLAYPNLSPKEAWLRREQEHWHLSKWSTIKDIEQAADKYYTKEECKILGLPANADNYKIPAKEAEVSVKSQKIDFNLPINASYESLNQARQAAERRVEEAKIRDPLFLPSSVPIKQAKKLAKAWQDFEQTYGVHVVHLSRTHIQIWSASQNVETEQFLGEFDSSTNQLEKAKKLTTQYIHTKEKSLQEKFHVHFGPENQKIHITNSLRDNPKPLDLGYSQTRIPTLAELVGIESALNKDIPKYYGQNKKTNLTFYFMSENREGFGALTCRNGFSSAIYFTASIASKPSTERELTDLGYHSAPIKNYSSVEETAIHELAHVSQDCTDWNKNPTYEQELHRLGWVQRKAQHFHTKSNQRWFLKAKDNYLYDCDRSDQTWRRVNAAGEELDKKGKIVNYKLAFKVSNEEMQKMAIHPPATAYIEEPHEEDAELMMLYRSGNGWRKRLQRNDSVIYGIIKNRDQEEINQQYGVDSNHQPKYVRDPSGLLKPNNLQEQRIIKAFESTK